MQINLFTCRAERNRVNKSDYITNRFAINGTIRKPTSAMNIVIEIEKKSNPVLYDYNYMYISEFKRYYFIDDIESVGMDRWVITASVDVLFSFMSDIYNTTAIIDKTENEQAANLYLDDGSFVMDSRKYNEIKEFPNGLNENGSYILICAGGI